VLFVAGVAPGDRVVARITESRRRFARGELLEVLEPGPGRRTPHCEYFERCGGCAWQHVDYETQLQTKREILRDALVRIGHLSLPDALPMTASPAEYGYRSRARIHVSGGRVGYREQRSHAICPISHCPVLVPELDHELTRLAQRAADEADVAEADEWEIRVGDGGLAQASPLGVSGAESTGPFALRVGEDVLSLSVGGFSQSNALLHDARVRAVCERVVGAGHSLLELYAGAGFFTISLARRFAEVHAVESSPAAVRDLRRNLAAAGQRHVRVTGARVEAVLAARADISCDVVFLDPPRAGLAGDAAADLASLGASRIVYLSCDPATLARDAAVLCGRGYTVVSVEGFDLFPQTPHVEALLVLEIG